ncbi:MAG: cytochrome P450 [Acidobacteria bacterium]|nr:cytochrome P450 [Acidobacteriota bacterium]
MAKILRPPGPRKKPLWGDLWDFRSDPLKFLANARSYGDIVFLRLGNQDIYLLNHPDYIKDVLVNQPRNFYKGRGLQRSKRLLGEGLLTSEEDFHKRQRRLVQPAFHRQRIANYAKVMVDYALGTRESWQPGKTINISEEMMRLTLRIVAKTLFNADVEKDADELGEAMGVFVKSFDFLTLPFVEILEKLPLPRVRAFNNARDLLDKTIYRMINDRREKKEDVGDLMSMLLIAQDEEGDGKGMTDLQVRDEVMTLFIAGHETTANALTWTWYLLSQHPEVETKVWREIDQVLYGHLPTAADYQNLKYTEMVLSEAMRLYPPAWVIGRRVVKECQVGGYTLPKDSIAFMSQYLMHRDERYFPEPEKFDPERWTPEAKEQRPKHSYFPFGGGPRQCIGEPFAWMEGVLLLATIAQKWKLSLAKDSKVEVQPMITLRAKNDIPMIVSLRDRTGNYL